MVKLSSQKLWGCMWVNIAICLMVLAASIFYSRSLVLAEEILWLISIYAVIPTFVVRVLMVAAQRYYGYMTHELSWCSRLDLTLSIAVLLLYLPSAFITTPPETLTEIGQKFAWRVKMVYAVNAIIFTWLVCSFGCDYLVWRQADKPEGNFSDFIANCLDAQKQSGGGS